MKKLILTLLAGMLISFAGKAQQSSWCTPVCTAPTQVGGGVTPLFTSVNGTDTTISTNMAHIQWADLNNSGFCWNYHNPAIKAYHVIVLQDNVPYFEDKNAYCYKFTDPCMIDVSFTGTFNEWFATTPGHEYEVTVCAVPSVDTIEACSSTYIFNTGTASTVKPSTTPVPGKQPGKKSKNNNSIK